MPTDHYDQSGANFAFKVWGMTRIIYINYNVFLGILKKVSYSMEVNISLAVHSSFVGILICQ